MLLRPALTAFLRVSLSAGCGATWYYNDQNLNQISVGDRKERIMQRFAPTNNEGRDVPGMQIRAARRTGNGKLLEVGEVPLITQTGTEKRVIPYRFLFEDGRLVQWGRPEDWRASSARYEIHFNPSPVVPR
jgi:hypothetical protein